MTVIIRKIKAFLKTSKSSLIHIALVSSLDNVVKAIELFVVTYIIRSLCL